MRANEFLIEAVVTPYEHETLTINTAVEMLNNYCSQSIAMLNSPIWRGMSNHKQDIFTLRPETGLRKSENTTNQYTEILSNSPYMRGWPRRDKSIICSTGLSYASGYAGYTAGVGTSETYAIFPYDNVEIAVCPGEDMWDTKVTIPLLKMRFGIEELNDVLNRHNLYGTYEEMVRQLNDPTSDQYEDVASELEINPPDLMPAILKAMTPEALGFKLMSIQEFAANPPHNKECWIGGPCVAMKESLWQKFRKAVVNRNSIHFPTHWRV